MKMNGKHYSNIGIRKGIEIWKTYFSIVIITIIMILTDVIIIILVIVAI